MSITNHQRTRIAAALRSILRAATGRDINPTEINVRVAQYLNAALVRGLGPSDPVAKSRPLFLADDYKPSSSQDFLGGPDGRDISRAWASVREDLDTIDEALTEAERRLNKALNLIRTQNTTISNDLNSISLDADSLKTQTQNIFFGGAGGASASGRGSSVWSVDTTDLVYPETTGIILPGGLASIPNNGQSASPGSNDVGSTIALVKLTGSSDQAMLQSDQTRAWAESPFTSTSSAWSFVAPAGSSATVNFKTVSSIPISVIRLAVSTGTTVLGLKQLSNGSTIAFTSLTIGSSLWIVLNSPILSGTEIQLSLDGVHQGVNSSGYGSVSNMQVFTFSLNSQASLVWGPFESSSENPDSLYTVTIDKVISALPTGATIDFGISTLSSDGPWYTVPNLGSPLLISGANLNSVELLPSQAQPDNLTLGYYYFPLSSQGSLYGATFSAGQNQAQVSAYYYNWNANGETVHTISSYDWQSPKGVPSTVAMGSAPYTYQGNIINQNFPSSSFVQSSTPLTRYLDSNNADLVYINLKGSDGSWTLTPGWNYKFEFALWTPGASYLPNVPVGLFNPNPGATGGSGAGLPGVPSLITLNGQTVYQGNTTFADFNELSPPAASLGQNIADYTNVSVGIGNSQQFQGNGVNWPPYAGRMNLTMKTGWNTLCVYLAIPASTTSIVGNSAPDPKIDSNLGPWAGFVFGPNLFADPTTLLNSTGIQQFRGWAEPWTQLSEFDLRQNNTAGNQEVWAWKVDPTSGTIQGILLNHNPSSSETGFITLDNVFSGQARNHNIQYQTQGTSTNQSLIPGQDPNSTKIWVKADLTTSIVNSGPLLESFQLTVN